MPGGRSLGGPAVPDRVGLISWGVITYRTCRQVIGWEVIEPVMRTPLRGASGCTLGPGPGVWDAQTAGPGRPRARESGARWPQEDNVWPVTTPVDSFSGITTHQHAARWIAQPEIIASGSGKFEGLRTLENPSGRAPAIAVKSVSRHSVIASGRAGPPEGVRLKRELPSRINILSSLCSRARLKSTLNKNSHFWCFLRTGKI